MWPFKEKQTFGYQPDTLDPRDVWIDEIYAGAEELPKSFKVEGLVFKDQGRRPFCVTMACIALAQLLYEKFTGRKHEFSQPHTFFHAGGGPNGSAIQANLDVMFGKDKGMISHEDLPMPEKPNEREDNWYEVERKHALGVPFKDTKKIPGYARVICLEKQLKSALITHGALIIPVAAYKEYFLGGAKRGYSMSDDNHVVLLKGWDDDLGVWLLHDSLMWKTNGEHTVDKSYQFQSARTITELPEDWREIRDEVRAEGAKNALNHYGMKRSLEREISVANELLVQLKAFNNQSVLEAAGRFWTVLINAIAYGGYTYRDCINDVYSWRRTGEHLFDFNHETREQWAKRVKGILT